MDNNEHNEDTPEVSLDLDAEQSDLEAAMRDAVAAVEAVEDDRDGTAGNEGNGAAAGSRAPESSDKEVARLRAEIADLRDRSMRTLADFDNFRKRSERERQEANKYALVEPLRAFLEIVDNLDLALMAAGGSADDLKRGVEMIHRQMLDLLRRFGVQEVAAQGKPFDPAVHEAVSREEDPGVKAPTVTAELRRGYKLHDRLLRPSMVKVSVPAEAPKPSGD